MARRRGGGGGGSTRAASEGEPEDVGWPVEWTCAALVVLVIAAIAALGRLAPSLFIGHCTMLSGMCTPAQCTCPPNLRKHELVTADEQACFRCIEEFCPAVTEGDDTCSTLPCECEDPSWPRVAVPGTGEGEAEGQPPCWQCVRPSFDFTLRAGAGDDSCLAPAPAPAPALGAVETALQTGVPRRLVTVRDRAACVAVRFDGVRIMERGRNGSCLAWHRFGAYWGFADCDAQDARMRFDALPAAVQQEVALSSLPGSALSPPLGAVYCSSPPAAGADGGPRSAPMSASGEVGSEPYAEYCIEVAERLCTEEEGRCSTEACRCANLSWTRQELQTLQDAQTCYNCVPPAVYCSTEPGTCSAGPCECADPSHARVPLGVEGEEAAEECFRCEPPFLGSVLRAPTLAFFAGVMLLGLAVGCCARRLIENRNGIASAQPVERPETWSERWAQELEYTLEDIYDLFVETPAALFRWLRPQFRQVGRAVSWLLDICDIVMEPCYCAIDWVQDVVWLCVGTVHGRLVVGALWLRSGNANGASWHDEGEDRCGKGGAGKRRRVKEERTSPVAEGLLEEEDKSGASPKDAQKARSRGHAGKAGPASSMPTVAAPISAKQRAAAAADGGGPAPQEQPAVANGRATAAAAAAAAEAAAAAKLREPLAWDPLNMTGTVCADAVAAPQVSATPPECVRVQAAPVHAPSSSSVSPPTRAAGAGGAGGGPLKAGSSTQSRMQRKLQQRREAMAQRGASEPTTAPAPSDESAPIDDSWIDELEKEAQVVASKKEAKQSKSRDRRRRGENRREVLVAATPLQPVAEHEEQPSAAPLHAAGSSEAADQSVPPAADEELQQGDEQEDDEQEEEEEAEEKGNGGHEDHQEEDDGEEEGGGEEEDDNNEDDDEAAEEEAEDEEEQISCEVHWEREVDGGGGWIRYDEATEQLITDAEAAGWSTLECRVRGQQYVIDLENMVQRAKKNGTRRAIRRQPPLERAAAPQAVDGLGARNGKTKSAPSGGDSSSAHGLRGGTGAASSKDAGDARRERPSGNLGASHGGSSSSSSNAKSGGGSSSSSGARGAGSATREPQAVAAEQSKPTNGSKRNQETQKTATKAMAAGTPAAAASGSSPGKGPRAYASVVAGVSTTAEAAAEALASKEGSGGVSAAAAAAAAGPTLSGTSANKTLAADAPEFVPASMMTQQPVQPIEIAKSSKQQKKKNKKTQENGEDRSQTTAALAAEGHVSTIVISGFPRALEAAGLKKLLDSWGLGGTYDFLFLFADSSMGGEIACAIINFIDPAFVSLFSFMYQNINPAGTISLADIQGLKANQEGFMQYCAAQEISFDVTAEEGIGGLGFRPSGMPPSRVFIEAVDPEGWSAQVGIDAGDELTAVQDYLVSEMSADELKSMRSERPLKLTMKREKVVAEPLADPFVIPNPTPSQWAVNTVNELIAPHMREQFRKTKLCTFHTQNRCEMGSACPFAHSQDELMPAPDLVKTKLCYNFFCKRCKDPRCKFAHGSQELRSDWARSMPTMCTWGSVPLATGVWNTPMMDFQALMTADPASAMMGAFPGMGVDGFMHPGMAMGSEVGLMGGYGDAAFMGVEALSEAGTDGTSSGLQAGQFSRGVSSEALLHVVRAGVAASTAASDAEASGSGNANTSSEAEGGASEGRRRRVGSAIPALGKQVMLREFGTFMESMQMREETMDASRQRSWSDSDLPAFREAMEDSLIG